MNEKLLEKHGWVVECYSPLEIRHEGTGSFASLWAADMVIQVLEEGEQVAEKFTFFWNGPFSQWEEAEFEIDGVKYNCAEQYMMASKAKMFNDDYTLQCIMESEDPREQKKLGRSVKDFDVERWNGVAREIVYEGNYAKFTQNPDLLDKLLATTGTTLVEASPYDCVWGIGMRETDEGVDDRDNWKGTNWLGETLTGLRDDLIDEGYLESEGDL